MEIETRVLNPLDTPAKQRALAAFLPIYVDAFPILDEREAPARWEERILAYADEETRSSVGTITTVIVAGHDLLHEDRLTVSGGIVIEVFPKSRTGLVSYIAVAPEARGQKVARALVQAAHEAFQDVAAAEQERRGKPFEIQAVFAEAEDPRRYPSPEERAVVLRRLGVLGHYGARWVDVPYLQPALDETRSAIDLLLLAIPLPGQSPHLIRTEVVWAFLAEHYGVSRDGALPTDEDLPPELRQRWGRIEGRLAQLMLEAESGAAGGGRAVSPADVARARESGLAVLRTPPSPESPLLALPRVAIALHTVTVEIPAGETAAMDEVSAAPGREAGALEPDALSARHASVRKRAGDAIRESELWSGLRDVPPATLLGGAAEAYCPVFNSFELDILNFRGIRDRPVVSVCWTAHPVDVEIHVPERTDFLAEGRGETWFGARTPIPARLALSFSRFPDSGVRVWHVVFRPRPTGPGDPYDGAFTELDLIKLITLYDGEQEEPNVPRGLRLSFPGAAPVPVDAFLFHVTGGALVGASFVAGTVEVELGGSQVESPVGWAALFDSASRPGSSELSDELRKYSDPGPGRERLLAASGVVQGIFDYGRLTVSEVSEVFRPVIRSSKSGWQSINCATLLDVSVGEKMLGVTGGSLGISPYKVVPHAVALHNEFVSRAAEAHTDRAAEAGRIASLARAADAADRLLRRLVVPNVFLYASEQELLDRITAHRGAATAREVAHSKLEELGGRLEREKALSSERRSHWLSAFLGLLSLVAVLDAVAFANEYRDGGPLSIGLVVGVVTAAAVVLGGLYAFARPRK